MKILKIKKNAKVKGGLNTTVNGHFIADKKS